jgi:hypothetical protein
VTRRSIARRVVVVRERSGDRGDGASHVRVSDVVVRGVAADASPARSRLRNSRERLRNARRAAGDDRRERRPLRSRSRSGLVERNPNAVPRDARVRDDDPRRRRVACGGGAGGRVNRRGVGAAPRQRAGSRGDARVVRALRAGERRGEERLGVAQGHDDPALFFVFFAIGVERDERSRGAERDGDGRDLRAGRRRRDAHGVRLRQRRQRARKRRRGARRVS